MIRQCAWCLLILGEVSPLSDKNVTHGICKECEDKLMKNLEKVNKKIGA